MSKEKKIIPRGQWILVRPLEEQTGETSQGLSLPASEKQEQKAQGTIEAIGDEVKKDIKKGDVVIYGAFAGENIKIKESNKDVDFKLLFDEDIIAIVK